MSAGTAAGTAGRREESREIPTAKGEAISSSMISDIERGSPRRWGSAPLLWSTGARVQCRAFAFYAAARVLAVNTPPVGKALDPRPRQPYRLPALSDPSVHRTRPDDHRHAPGRSSLCMWLPAPSASLWATKRRNSLRATAAADAPTLRMRSRTPTRRLRPNLIVERG